MDLDILVVLISTVNIALSPLHPLIRSDASALLRASAGMNGSLEAELGQ